MRRFEAAAWFVIMAPAGPPAIVQRIDAIANRYLQSAKGKDMAAKQAIEAGGRAHAGRLAAPSSNQSSKVGASNQRGEHWLRLDSEQSDHV